MINDIENYLFDKEKYVTMQQVLGIDMLFRGFIVKDWFGKDQNACKYGMYNKAIIKLCA